MDILSKLYHLLPGIKNPDRTLTFKEKITWSGIVLILYFILSQITVFGVSENVSQYLKNFEVILGASMGTIITLGIGPIVTSSIILQLLVGARVIPWDLKSREGRIKFQGTQKLLAFVFALLEAFAFVAMGAIKPDPTGGLILFIIVVLQVAVGGWLIIFMDELVSKWGFGSGVGLFIVAGVSKGIMVGLVGPFYAAGEFFTEMNPPSGAIIRFILHPGLEPLIPIIATLVVFLIAVYAQAMRIEIPLTFANVRGFGRKWPLKFIYTNVLPVILISALLSNVALWATILSDRNIDLEIWGFHLIGDYERGSPPDNSLMYYLSSPRNFMSNLVNMNVRVQEVLQVISYTLVYVFGAIVFSIFWMKTSGQDPESVASQIESVGMSVPGFRRDRRVIVKVLNRYIPALTVLGGAFIGFLAAFANWTSAIGRGTGILLAVMIVYQLYEELARQHMEDMHPILKKFMANV